MITNFINIEDEEQRSSAASDAQITKQDTLPYCGSCKGNPNPKFP